LCKSIELRKTLGSAAQETARHYTWAAAARKLEYVLRTAVGAKNAGTQI